MQQLSLENRIHRISEHVVRARLFFDLWLYFEGEETRPTIIEAMRDYNEFFRFTPHAYFTSYIIYMAGMFENRGDTINFVQLIREASKGGRPTTAETSKIDKLMTEAKPLAGKLTILRHNAFAHRSANLSYNDAFKKASVSKDELRQLTDIALEIANQLLKVFGLQAQYFTPLPRNAAEAMMKALDRRNVSAR